MIINGAPLYGGEPQQVNAAGMIRQLTLVRDLVMLPTHEVQPQGMQV